MPVPILVFPLFLKPKSDFIQCRFLEKQWPTGGSRPTGVRDTPAVIAQASPACVSTFVVACRWLVACNQRARFGIIWGCVSQRIKTGGAIGACEGLGGRRKFPVLLGPELKPWQASRTKRYFLSGLVPPTSFRHQAEGLRCCNSTRPRQGVVMLISAGWGRGVLCKASGECPALV